MKKFTKQGVINSLYNLVGGHTFDGIVFAGLSFKDMEIANTRAVINDVENFFNIYISLPGFTGKEMPATVTVGELASIVLYKLKFAERLK